MFVRFLHPMTHLMPHSVVMHDTVYTHVYMLMHSQFRIHAIVQLPAFAATTASTSILLLMARIS